VLLCDTGPLVAALSRRDPHHAACSELLRRHGGELAAPAPVITETAFFALGKLGTEAQARFLDAVAAGEIEVLDLEREDHERVAELCRHYADLPLDQVDASVVALADRLGLAQVASLDWRHLGVVRLSGGRFLELLPAVQ
jgi:predicted nucleic acid-binding protein